MTTTNNNSNGKCQGHEGLIAYVMAYISQENKDRDLRDIVETVLYRGQMLIGQYCSKGCTSIMDCPESRARYSVPRFVDDPDEVYYEGMDLQRILDQSG